MQCWSFDKMVFISQFAVQKWGSQQNTTTLPPTLPPFHQFLILSTHSRYIIFHQCLFDVSLLANFSLKSNFHASGRGLKNASTADWGTSLRDLYDQVGVDPLSTNTALTPSEKSFPFTKCSLILQSEMKASLRFLSLDLLMFWNVMWTESGECWLMVLRTSWQKGSLGFASNFLTRSCTEPTSKSSLIFSQFSSGVVALTSVYFDRIFSISWLGLLLEGIALSSSAYIFGMLALGTQQLASPALQTSSPFSCAPVVPRQQPRLFLILDRTKPEATSVKNPSLFSGMAKMVLSVAILKGEWMLMPTPPPITTPSQLLICRDFNWLKWQSSVNSCLKKLVASSMSLYMLLTSPPAQKAFPPAPSIQNALVFWISGSSFTRSWIISSLRALRALGRFRVSLPNPPIFSNSTALNVIFWEKCLVSCMSRKDIDDNNNRLQMDHQLRQIDQSNLREGRFELNGTSTGTVKNLDVFPDYSAKISIFRHMCMNVDILLRSSLCLALPHDLKGALLLGSPKNSIKCLPSQF